MQFNPQLTYISQVKSYLQVPPEVVCKTGVHIQDLQQVVSLDAVQVTVGDGVHICIRFSWLIIQVYGLPEDVILLYKNRAKDVFKVMYKEKGFFFTAQLNCLSKTTGYST